MVETSIAGAHRVAAAERPIVVSVVQQHLEDAQHLRALRRVLVRAPHVRLLQLARLDERLAAHLDGLLVAGREGAAMVQEGLESAAVGSIFVNAVLAFQRADAAAVDRILALLPVVPEAAQPAVASALGWLAPEALRGRVVSWLGASEPWLRWAAIAGCMAHRVDPGAALVAALEQPEEQGLCQLACKAAAQLGRSDVRETLQALLQSRHPGVASSAAVAAVRLGDSGQALDWVRRNAAQALVGAMKTRPNRVQSGIKETDAAPNAHADALSTKPSGAAALLQLTLAAEPPAKASATARQIGAGQLTSAHTPAQSQHMRWAIQATAWAGDVSLVPWLIECMAEPGLARLAGEAFSTLTGADLALLDLDHKGETPTLAQGVAIGPNDDPADDAVDLDEDENLPWPSQAAVHRWWQQAAGTMPPAAVQGVRTLAGQPVSAEHGLQVLRQQGQRVRALAALHLGLAHPQQPLFNVAAPAARQQRQLGLPVRVI